MAAQEARQGLRVVFGLGAPEHARPRSGQRVVQPDGVVVEQAQARIRGEIGRMQRKARKQQQRRAVETASDERERAVWPALGVAGRGRQRRAVAFPAQPAGDVRRRGFPRLHARQRSPLRRATEARLRRAWREARLVRMETTFAFDTLAYARKLKAAGVADSQAEAHAEAVRDAVVQGFASKADIQRLEDKIDALAAGKADKADIRRLEDMIAALAEGKADKSDIARLEEKIGHVEEKIEIEVRRIEEKIEAKADKADIQRLEASISELKVTVLLAIVGVAGLLFAALQVFGGAP